jgi:hypothetical protein
MKRRRDDFPRSHIRRLIYYNLSMLADDKLIYTALENKFQLAGDYSSEDVEGIYRIFLYRAW